MGRAMVRRCSVADLATADVQQTLEEYLAALRDGDTAKMITFVWWNGDAELDRYVAPAHLTFDVPTAPAGATHLTIEERAL
jgi:hypothetical protein